MSIDRSFETITKTHELDGIRFAYGVAREWHKRRFPVAMPRWERRRMANLRRRDCHAYMVLARLNEVKQHARWDDAARLDKVERLKLSIDYEGYEEYQDTRANGDPWIVYENSDLSNVLAHAADVRAAIDAVPEPDTEWRTEGIW